MVWFTSFVENFYQLLSLPINKALYFRLKSLTRSSYKIPLVDCSMPPFCHCHMWMTCNTGPLHIPFPCKMCSEVLLCVKSSFHHYDHSKGNFEFLTSVVSKKNSASFSLSPYITLNHSSFIFNHLIFFPSKIDVFFNIDCTTIDQHYVLWMTYCTL